MSRLLLVALAAVALAQPASVEAKGFTRLVLVGPDRRAVEIHGSEETITDWVRNGAPPQLARGGYLRLFFVGAGDFPANPARYFPRLGCIAPDWPRLGRSCLAVDPALARLLRRACGLPRFGARPTVLQRVTYLGKRTFSRFIASAAALKGPIELALDRSPRPAAAEPRGCFRLAGVWRGPAARHRPTRFALCHSGVYAAGRLYPLRSGVWSWLDLNLGP